MDYQMMEKSDIPNEVCECARVKVTEEEGGGRNSILFSNGCYLGSHIFYEACR